MALSASALQQCILDKFSALSAFDRAEALHAHGAWADAIEEYIVDNLRVQGVYSGTVPGGGPDPLNGTYIWGGLGLSISGSALFSGATSFSSWGSALGMAIQGGVFVGMDESGVVTATPGFTLALYSLVVVQSDIQGGDFEGVVGYMAVKIVSALQSMVVSGLVSPATSVSGSGNVTYSSFV